MKDLGHRSISAVFWGGGGTALRLLLQIGTQIVLARALGPAQYGLFAIAAIVISLSNFFSDIGLAYGLIQKETVSEEELRFVFTWQLLLGLLVTAAITALSGPLAQLLGNASAQGLIAALAGVCLLNALSAPALNMLKRQLDFRRIQLANVTSYAVGYVLVGVPVALLSGSVWALVLAWLVQAGLSLVLLYAAHRHPLRPRLWFPGALGMARYGATVFATNLVNWSIGNIERVLIARFFATREVGLYATAYNLMYAPMSSLLGITQPVFFSSGARMGEDPQRVVRTYLALVGLVAVLALPACAGLAAVAETLILALYGPAWQEAAPLLVPLALAMPLFLLWGLTTPMLWLGGRASSEFRLQLPMAVAWVLVSLLAAQVSVLCVAWAVLGLFLLRYLLILATAHRLLKLPLLRLGQSLAQGVLLALICSGALALIDHGLSTAGLAAPVRLPLLVLGGACTLGALLALVPRLVPADCAPLLERLAQRCPPRLAALLRRHIRS